MATPNRASSDQPHAQGRPEALQAGARRRRTARCSSICCSPACVENSPHESAEQVFNTLKARLLRLERSPREHDPRADRSDQAAGRSARGGRPAQANAAQRVRVASTSSTSKRSRSRTSARPSSSCKSYNGSTPFVVAYVTQHALGGHSIPAQPRAADRDARRRRDLRQRVCQGRRARPGARRAQDQGRRSRLAACISWASRSAATRTAQTPASCCWRSIPKCKDRLPKRPTPARSRRAPPQPPPPAGQGQGRRRRTTRRSRPQKQPPPPSRAKKEAAAAKKKPTTKPTKRRRRSPAPTRSRPRRHKKATTTQTRRNAKTASSD